MALQNKISNIIQGFKEAFTGYAGVISSDHAYIHEGKGFKVVYTVTGLASGAKTYIGITTPPVASGVYSHFRPVGMSSSNSGVVLKIYENLTYSGGSSYTPFNVNRNIGNASISAVSIGVTATPGAQLVIAAAGVGSGGNVVSSSGGAASGEANEIILDQETEYVVEIENIGASATTTTITVFWYEEERGL